MQNIKFIKKTIILTLLLLITAFFIPVFAHGQVVRNTVIKTAKAISKVSNATKEELQDIIKPAQKKAVLNGATKEALADITLYTTLAEIKSPIAPFSYGPYHIFIHYDELGDSRVQIAFEDEQYFSLHNFVRLASNKKVLVYAIEHDTRYMLTYRLVVDGVWTHDIQNEQWTIDKNGVRVSVTEAKPYSNILSSSVIYNNNNNTLRFTFLLNNSIQKLQSTALKDIDIDEIKFKEIYLVGNFTAWDPFFLKMHKSSENPNLYYIDLDANLGIYNYYFQVGNYSILDPKNRDIRQRRDGAIYTSSFEVQKSTTELTGASIKLVQINE